MEDPAPPPATTGKVIHWAFWYDLLVWAISLGREQAFRQKQIDLAGVASQNLVRPEFFRKSRQLRIAARGVVNGSDGRLPGANQVSRRDKAAPFAKDSPILSGWLAGPLELIIPATSWR